MHGFKHALPSYLLNHSIFGTFDIFCSDGGTVYPCLLRPKSRGFIQLRSKNPQDPPIIQPNYFSNPEDLTTMRAGFKLSLKLSRSQAFQKNQIEPIVDRSGCQDFEPFSDDYIDCFLRHWSFTIFHPVGTCKMGPKSDPYAVVDTELKVHRVKNLRVIDASIMPTIVGGNTHAAAVMIGEKGADMIIQKWKKIGNEKVVKLSKTEL